MTPILSIIIPVYNVEAYLSKCLDSVIQQTIQNIEIICVNDASTDNSGDILRKYDQAHTNITIVERDCNGGLVSARNTGYALAKGKYIYYLDSDDYLLTDVLGEIVKYCEENSLDMVLFNAITSRNNTKYYDLKRQTSISSGKLHYSNFFKYNNFFPPSVQWLYLYKKTFLDENDISFPVDNLQEDEPFTVKAFLKANRVGNLDIPVVYHRVMREGSITNTAGLNHLEHAKIAWKNLYMYLNNNQCTEPVFYAKIFDLYVNTITKLQKNFPGILDDFFEKNDKLIVKACVINLDAYKYYFYFSIGSSALIWYESLHTSNIIKKIINRLVTIYYNYFYAKQRY